MRHHNSNRKLGRKKNQRRALLKTLAVSLVMRERIETTEAKAKELKPFAEKLITYGKKETLAGRRLIAGSVGEKAAKKIFTDIAPRYKTRNGGYIRIVKAGVRISDGSKKSIVEFV